MYLSQSTSDCGFKLMNRFVRYMCTNSTGQKQVYKCLNSDVWYEYVNAPTKPGYIETFTQTCPNDYLHYQACSSFDFQKSTLHPKVLGTNLDLVCGIYVCDLYPRNSLSGQLIIDFYSCNGISECNNWIDEQYCSNEKDAFKCDATFEVAKQKVCDGLCDCAYCQDEFNCNAVSHFFTCPNTTDVLHPLDVCNGKQECPRGEDEMDCRYEDEVNNCNMVSGYLTLTNYTRCTPWLLCHSFYDQTNCTANNLTVLSCKVRGYDSTIAARLVCNSTPLTQQNIPFPIVRAVCDDGMDQKCRTLTAQCYIHKHQLCNNIPDCTDGADENTLLCRQLTSLNCTTRYMKQERPIPVTWISDGVVDCEGGIDEEVTRWKKCSYPKFTIYGLPQCRDVFLCPRNNSRYIMKELLCDSVVKCEGENGFCLSHAAKNLKTTALVTQTPQNEPLILISYCLPGLQDLTLKGMRCTRIQYPMSTVYGASRNKLLAPLQPMNCRFAYGEIYVYQSCTGRCSGTPCPISEAPLSGKSCYGIKSYSITEQGKIVFVKQFKSTIRVDNTYECGNGNCVPYEKVCNLVDDCGDGSDERLCTNSFKCSPGNTTQSRDYVPLSSVCDGSFDCNNLSDELSCCTKQVIVGVTLKVFSWTIGISATILNTYVIGQNIRTLPRTRTNSALLDKSLISLIGVGDLLVGWYIIIISIMDAISTDDFCYKQFDWLVSFKCLSLGIVSTLGSQISVFTLMVLSLSRAIRVTKGLAISKSVDKIAVIKTLAIVFLVLGISLAISITPLLPPFEDFFVNAVYFPEIKFLKGFLTKVQAEYVIKEYYGRISKSNLYWRNIRLLLHKMFTDSYDGIQEYVLHFYGNDPVCLFKYFVISTDPQTPYSWSILGIIFFCFLVVTCSYMIVITYALQSSRTIVGNGTSKTVRNRNQRLQRKITIIISTDFLCWMPFIIICLLNTTGTMDASPLYGFFSIVVLPINSVINPLLYDDISSKILLYAKRVYAKIEPPKANRSNTCNKTANTAITDTNL